MHSSRMRTTRTLPYWEGLPDRDPPWTESPRTETPLPLDIDPPLDRDPSLDRDPPGQRPPPPGQRPPQIETL